jgi:hypothetical protein
MKKIFRPVLALSLVITLLLFAAPVSAEDPIEVKVLDSVEPIESMAAPNIAEIILEAEGVMANQLIGKGKNRTFIHLIQLTAHHMGPQTDFDGVPKYVLVGEPGEEVAYLNPDYWDAVLSFLNGRIAYYGLGIGPLTYSYDDYVADQSEPGELLEEDFTGVSEGAIPAGWGTTHVDNWYVIVGNDAGGTSPEMRFIWFPSFTGTSRLISTVIDASTYSDIELSFKHFVDDWEDYPDTYALKVQVSLDGGTIWADAWSITAGAADIGPETVTVDLSTYDGDTFKLAWVFVGESPYIDYWYIDDILVTGN